MLLTAAYTGIRSFGLHSGALCKQTPNAVGSSEQSQKHVEKRLTEANYRYSTAGNIDRNQR